MKTRIYAAPEVKGVIFFFGWQIVKVSPLMGCSIKIEGVIADRMALSAPRYPISGTNEVKVTLIPSTSSEQRLVTEVRCRNFQAVLWHVRPFSYVMIIIQSHLPLYC